MDETDEPDDSPIPIEVEGLEEGTVTIDANVVVQVRNNPERVYVINWTGPAGLCLNLTPDASDDHYSVIAHNLRRLWIWSIDKDMGIEDAIWLNELHELSHWAAYPHDDTELGDGHGEDGWNEVMFGIVDWVSEEEQSCQ